MWWMKGFRVKNGVHKERMEMRREKRVSVVQKTQIIPLKCSHFKGKIVILYKL